MLEGVRVLELGHIVAGPSAGLILADLGADVCKVEDPRSGDTARNQANAGSTYFTFNRNKRSVALNLREPAGREVFERLVARSDVVLDNYSNGALERLGIGYAWGSSVNPRIIYCSIKGFLNGPYETRPYLDELAQMEGGLAYCTGLPGRPLRAAASIVDMGAAAFGVIGILAALYRRQLSGTGEDIRAGLFETTVYWMNQHFTQVQLMGASPGPNPADAISASRMGGAMGWGVYQLFETRDGKQIFIAVTTNRHWSSLCRLLGLADLSDDPTFNTNAKRAINRLQFIDRIMAAVKRFDQAEIMRCLREVDVPYAPVNRPVDLIDEPHLNAGDHLLEVTLSDGRTFKLPTPPVSMQSHHYAARMPPPALGEHTQEVLSEIGYAPAEIDALQSTQTVLQSERMLGIDAQLC